MLRSAGKCECIQRVSQLVSSTHGRHGGLRLIEVACKSLRARSAGHAGVLELGVHGTL